MLKKVKKNNLDYYFSENDTLNDRIKKWSYRRTDKFILFIIVAFIWVFISTILMFKTLFCLMTGNIDLLFLLLTSVFLILSLLTLKLYNEFDRVDRIYKQYLTIFIGNKISQRSKT